MSSEKREILRLVELVADRMEVVAPGAMPGFWDLRAHVEQLDDTSASLADYLHQARHMAVEAGVVPTF